MDWLDFMKAMLPNGLDISEDEVVINYVPEFFERLGEVINSTSKSTMANYFLWRIVLSKSKDLSDELRNHVLEYERDTFYGIQDILMIGERWRACMLDTISR